MSDIPYKDPRPLARHKWVKKHRKVEPVLLNNTQATQNKPHARIRELSVDAGIETYNGEWSETQASHLLRRTLFGIKKEELRHFSNLTLSQAVKELLKDSPKPEPPVNNYNDLSADIEDPHVAEGETWVEAPYSNQNEANRIISLKSWVINNFLTQEATIHEKMILFWHNLLVTQSWDVFVSKTSYQYFEMLREHALGNYKAMIKALTLDPAMLLFLNGTLNHKDAPDENYARELQELFCIGKGPNSKYTERDVQLAAKILTGWVINWDDDIMKEGRAGTYFFPPIHDTSDKEFSEFYGNRVIEGRSGERGKEELDELLDMIFDNEETAYYICRRIYTFFVYGEIDANTEERVIKPLAKIFRESNYEIKPVLEALFQSEHFFHPLNQGAQVKNPTDLLLAAWRTFEMPTELDDSSKTTQLHISMLWQMANMGMEIGDPPSVAGWPAYYQAPQFDRSWITTDTITNRAAITDSMIFWGFWVNQQVQVNIDFLTFLKALDKPDDPNELLKEVSTLLFGYPVSEATLQSLKGILLSGQQTDGYWTNAWTLYRKAPDNEEYKLAVENRLKSTFQRLLQLAENQLI